MKQDLEHKYVMEIGTQLGSALRKTDEYSCRVRDWLHNNRQQSLQEMVRRMEQRQYTGRRSR